MLDAVVRIAKGALDSVLVTICNLVCKRSLG